METRADDSRGSGTPAGSFQMQSAAVRAAKKAAEAKSGGPPPPPASFYCAECEVYYLETDFLTGKERQGRCPVHTGSQKRKSPAVA